MHGLTDGHHLHSYVLLFLCLDYMFASCFVFIKNAVLALQILCMMGMWQDRRKLAYAWTGGWTSSAFLCSFVLLSLFIVMSYLEMFKYLFQVRDDGARADAKCCEFGVELLVVWVIFSIFA